MKIFLYISCLIIIAVAMAQQPQVPLMGGSNKVEKGSEEQKEIEKLFHDNKHLLKDDDGKESKLILISVDEIEKQVVAGVLYKIFGVFGEGGKKFKCEVHIWSRPWIANGTVLTVKNKTELV